MLVPHSIEVNEEVEAPQIWQPWRQEQTYKRNKLRIWSSVLLTRYLTDVVDDLIIVIVIGKEKKRQLINSWMLRDISKSSFTLQWKLLIDPWSIWG